MTKHNKLKKSNIKKKSKTRNNKKVSNTKKCLLIKKFESKILPPFQDSINECQNIIERKTEKYKYKLYSLHDIVSLIINKFSKVKKPNYEKLFKFFNIYDIDNNINSQFFKILKLENITMFKNLIKKYKYTLDYKTSLELGCLTKEEIKKEIKLYNSNINIIKGQILKEKEIISFSKIKFFNLLFEFIKLNPKYNYFVFYKIDKIIDKIKLNFKIEKDLFFKSPNSFGTIELRYYTLIYLYYKFLFNDGEYNNELIKFKDNETDDIRTKNDLIKEIKINYNDNIYTNDFKELFKE